MLRARALRFSTRSRPCGLRIPNIISPLWKHSNIDNSRYISTTINDVADFSLTPTLGKIVDSNGVHGEPVKLSGHIRTCRTMKKMSFVDISDGASSAVLNVIFPGEDSIANYNLKVGQSVEIYGEWRDLPVKQRLEIHCDPSQANHSVSIIGQVPDRYPIQKKATSLEFLRTLPTLRHRTRTLGQILRARSFIEGSLMDYFRREDFIKVSPPIISGSDCEGAGELFYVGSTGKKNFFKKSTYLTVSTQLHLEVLSAALNRVWTMTPCFRAENSDTTRHLSEFWMLEAEVAYVDDVRQLTTLCDNMLKSIVQDMKSHKTFSSEMESSFPNEDTMAKIKERWATFENSNLSWPTITYSMALEIINDVQRADNSKKLEWGATLNTEHEKWLAGEYFKTPVFVTDYPSFQKPFYMRKSNPEIYDPEKPTVACFDLLIPEVGELIGGSLRIHDYDELMEQIEERKMDKKALEWYISLRRNGTVPHGGFGLGFERLVMYLSGTENIRDTIPFPRTPGHCQC